MAVIEYMNVVLGMNHQKFDGDVDKVNKKVGQMSGMFKASFFGNLAANTAYSGLSRLGDGMLEFGKNSIKASMDAEMAEVAFTTMLGSVEKATSLISDMRKLDQSSPLNYQDFEQAGKVMLAFGMSSSEVTKRMDQLAAISLGNADRFQSLALAFSQTTAAGRLMGQEVLQFVNAGFNPLQQISKMTGESMASLKKRMEEGGVSVDEVRKAFDAATGAGGTFFEMNEKLAGTTAGQLAKLEGNIKAMQRNLGNAFKPITDSIIDGLKRLTDQSEQSARRMADLSEMAGGPKTAIATPHGSLKRGIDVGAVGMGGSGLGAMSALIGNYDILTKRIDNAGHAAEAAKKKLEEMDKVRNDQLAEEAAEIEKRQLLEKEAIEKRLAEEKKIRDDQQIADTKRKFEELQRWMEGQHEKAERAASLLSENDPFANSVDKVAEMLALMQEGFLNPQQFDRLARQEAMTLAESQTEQRRDTPAAMAGSVEAYKIFLERDQDRAKEREIAMKSERHLEALLNEAKNRPSLGVARR